MVCESRESMPFLPVVNVFVAVDESVKFHDIVVGVSKNPIFSCQLSGIVHGMHFRAPFCGIHPGKQDGSLLLLLVIMGSVEPVIS